MLGPILRGELISLEPAKSDYLEDFIRWFADMDVTRNLLYRTPLSLDQEKEWFDRVSHDKTTVHWTIMRESQPIGVSGIHNIDWISRSAITGTVIGEKSQWGKGFASESVRLRTGFAFTELNLERLETESMARNLGMHKALERSGYQRIGLRTGAHFREGERIDSVLFELHRKDWLSATQQKGS